MVAWKELEVEIINKTKNRIVEGLGRVRIASLISGDRLMIEYHILSRFPLGKCQRLEVGD